LRTSLFRTVSSEYENMLTNHRKRWSPIAFSKASQIDEVVAMTPKSALFLAEAPGMFAKYFTESYNVTDWVGVSLDDLSDPFGFIQKTREHWLFEDVRDFEVLRKFDLVTVDLGFRPSSASTQALEHFDVHVTALQKALDHVSFGGTIIMKLYGGTETAFALENFNAGESFFFKPEASNVYNDEVYLILNNVRKCQCLTLTRVLKTVLEPTLNEIWKWKMGAYASMLGMEFWVPEHLRFYVDVSGHLANFMLVSDYALFDFGRYLDNIEGNVKNKGPAPRPIDEAGSGGLWHSAVEWFLATYAAEEISKRYGLRLDIGMVAYVRGRLLELSRKYPRFNQRSESVSLEFPDSSRIFDLTWLVPSC